MSKLIVGVLLTIGLLIPMPVHARTGRIYVPLVPQMWLPGGALTGRIFCQPGVDEPETIIEFRAVDGRSWYALTIPAWENWFILRVPDGTLGWIRWNAQIVPITDSSGNSIQQPFMAQQNAGEIYVQLECKQL
jgi:hypothetical protein